jgi:uncharacterized membrane protein
MKSYIPIILALFIFQACTSPEKRVEKADSSKIVEHLPIPADTTSSLFKGLYTFGNEVRTFQDCSGGGKIYWVNDSMASLSQRYEDTNRFPSYPYESVYVEVKGYLSGKSQMGYASEYENVLIVTDIVKVEAKNFRTECYNYEFIALGNEPFWSLEIIPGEKRIVFKDVGVEKVTEFIYAPAKMEDGVLKYEATSPSNDKLVAIIRMEKCSDGMSDRQYNYSAEITVNGKVNKGCAIKKGEIFNDQP